MLYRSLQHFWLHIILILLYCNEDIYYCPTNSVQFWCHICILSCANIIPLWTFILISHHWQCQNWKLARFIYLQKYVLMTFISQNRCHPAPYEDKVVVTINTMIFTRCIGQVAAVSHGRNGSCIMMLAMWPVHGQCGHYPPICVSPGRMRGNNSPVCHRKPLLSPHNPLQQSNTNLSLSIGYNHQDIYQQDCKWMQSQVISISS